MHHDAAPNAEADDEVSLLDTALPLVQHWRLLVLGPVLAGLLALGIASALPKTYTARTTLIPPQQQSSGSAALAQLGALAGLAGGAGLKTPADQYAALMQSQTVADRLVDRFDLMRVYDLKLRTDARKQLATNVQISVGKKDGLISVEVDDHEPQRAADLANAHVEELRRLGASLALTEAQQRRVFFEDHLKQTRDRLVKAQQEVQASGFTQGALQAEPKAAAEGYAKLRAELTSAEVKLQTLRRNLADATPEVQQQVAMVSALRSQLAALERGSDLGGSADYVGKYREFKYQETLFELFARQYELARLDESREGTLIQVVDPAQAPEKKSRPKRALIALSAFFGTGVLLLVFVLVRHAWRRSAEQPETAARMDRLRQAWRGR
jgi:uncharacterized protein involved in exopolysaccharide biosynthesis